MQKYIHYNKWTGTINSQSNKESDYSLLLSTNEIDKLLEYGLENYIVHNNQVIKKDNIVRFNKEKKLTEIKYDKYGTVKLNIYPDDNLIKLHVDPPLRFIDKQQIDRIKFEDPILKIFVHSKKSPELLGTLEIDLNEYFKTGKYEQDISTVLSKVNIEDLVFKTQRCFEKYAYEILESDRIKIKKVDRNLINEDYHIIIKYDGKILIIQNNIRYWQEVENILNDKLVISFVDKLNHNKIEHYIPFTLMLLQTKKYLTYRIPTYCNIFDKLIKINSKQLKIKYENTSN